MICRLIDNRRLAAFFALVISLGVFSTSDVLLAAGRRRNSDAHPKMNLSQQQRERLQKHIKESRARQSAIIAQLRAARLDLYQQLSQYKLNDRQVQSSVRKINSLQVRMHEANLENQLKLRSILSKEQFEELTKAVRGRRFDAAGLLDDMDGDYVKSADVKGIELSKEQKERIAELFEESGQKTTTLVKRLKDDASSLHKLYLEFNLDAKQAKSRIARLGQTQQDLIQAMVNRQVELRRILTERQFTALSKSIKPPSLPGGPGGPAQHGHRRSRG